MSGPRLALRDVLDGHRVVDLLVYDDVLAVVPTRGGWGIGDSDVVGWVVGAVLSFTVEPALRRRRSRREQSVSTLPRRTRRLLLAEIGSVHVRPLAYGEAVLHVDGHRYDVRPADQYRKPWADLLGPIFGDRLTVDAR